MRVYGFWRFTIFYQKWGSAEWRHCVGLGCSRHKSNNHCSGTGGEQLLQFNPEAARHHSHFAHSPILVRWGRELEKKLKPMGWDKNYLLKQRRKGEKKKQQPNTIVVITVCVSICTLTKSVMHNAIAHHPLARPQAMAASPPGQVPRIYNFTWCHIGRKISSASLGQLSWVCPLPSPCASPVSSLAGQCEELKCP